MVAAPVAGGADAHDRPVTRRNVPVERTVRRPVRGDVYDAFLRDGHLRRKLLHVAGRMLAAVVRRNGIVKELGAVVAESPIEGLARARAPRLVREVRQPGAGLRRREREDADVLVPAVVVFDPAFEDRVETGRSLRERGLCHDHLHRLVGRDPGAAGVRPAGAVAQAHLEAEAFALLVDVPHKAEPFRCAEHDRPRRDVAADVEHLDASDAGGGQRLEVAGYALLRDVAVHQVVQRVRGCGTRRRAETLFQPGRAKCQEGGPGRPCQQDS